MSFELLFPFHKWSIFKTNEISVSACNPIRDGQCSRLEWSRIKRASLPSTLTPCCDPEKESDKSSWNVPNNKQKEQVKLNVLFSHQRGAVNLLEDELRSRGKRNENRRERKTSIIRELNVAELLCSGIVMDPRKQSYCWSD